MPKSRAAGGRFETSRPADLDHAFVLRVEARDRAQQRGLAAAGGAEEADELALLHVERDVLQRGELAEVLVQIADAQEWRGGRMTR